MALIAWLPENVIWGKPKIIDTLIVSGRSVAEARDRHYHQPPKYLVLEPEDTTGRTANLQQTNTNGYVLQEENNRQLLEAQNIVNSWGNSGLVYSPNIEYQNLLRTLLSTFPYRGDTNYAKIDRIQHTDIEEFKTRVLNSNFQGKTISQWRRIFASNNDETVETALATIL